MNYIGDVMGLDLVDIRGFEVPMKRGLAHPLWKSLSLWYILPNEEIG